MPGPTIETCEEILLRAARAWARMHTFGTSLDDGLIAHAGPRSTQDEMEAHLLRKLKEEALLYYQRVGDTKDVP